jgi:hypothetical protein
MARVAIPTFFSDPNTRAVATRTPATLSKRWILPYLSTTRVGLATGAVGKRGARMFFVGDTRAQRLAMIQSYQGQEAVIGALLAAIDFEWTVRRAILALGKNTNQHIRANALYRASSLEKYKKAWNAEVFHNPKHIGIKELPDVVGHWEALLKAYNLRHQLSHGIKVNSGELYAASKRDTITTARDRVLDCCEAHGIDIYKRLPVRRKPI